MTTNLDLRWYVKRTEWDQWDDRTDHWYPRSTETAPVSQVKINGEWKDVPVVIDIKKT